MPASLQGRTAYSLLCTTVAGVLCCTAWKALAALLLRHALRHCASPLPHPPLVQVCAARKSTVHTEADHTFTISYDILVCSVSRLGGLQTALGRVRGQGQASDCPPQRMRMARDEVTCLPSTYRHGKQGLAPE